MNILVINGSPKGKYSITLQTSLYLEILYTEHHFQYLSVGQSIKSLEKDFTVAVDAMKEADLIIFSYPVYIRQGNFLGILYENPKLII